MRPPPPNAPSDAPELVPRPARRGPQALGASAASPFDRGQFMRLRLPLIPWLDPQHGHRPARHGRALRIVSYRHQDVYGLSGLAPGATLVRDPCPPLSTRTVYQPSHPGRGGLLRRVKNGAPRRPRVPRQPVTRAGAGTVPVRGATPHRGPRRAARRALGAAGAVHGGTERRSAGRKASKRESTDRVRPRRRATCTGEGRDSFGPGPAPRRRGPGRLVREDRSPGTALRDPDELVPAGHEGAVQPITAWRRPSLERGLRRGAARSERTSRGSHPFPTWGQPVSPPPSTPHGCGAQECSSRVSGTLAMFRSPSTTALSTGGRRQQLPNDSSRSPVSPERPSTARCAQLPVCD